METPSFTQEEFIKQVILKNAEQTHPTEEELTNQLLAFDELKGKIRQTVIEIDENVGSKLFGGNVFPYFSLIIKEGIEYINNAGVYERNHQTYQEAINRWLDAVSIYIRNPLLHCSELTSLFLVFFFWLKERFFSNFYGFKLLNPTCGWRYNFWGTFIGNYGWTLVVGTLTSGFVIFPLLISLAFFYPVEQLFFIPVIAGFLLTYKVFRMFFDILFYKLGFKNKYQKALAPYAYAFDYLVNNDILQPSKLQDLTSKINDLPAAINIIISMMSNGKDIAYNDYGNFLKLYKNNK